MGNEDSSFHTDSIFFLHTDSFFSFTRIQYFFFHTDSKDFKDVGFADYAYHNALHGRVLCPSAIRMAECIGFFDASNLVAAQQSF